jgi:hypothetical protein
MMGGEEVEEERDFFNRRRFLGKLSKLV